MTQVKSAFEFISSTEVSSLNLTVEHYQHTKTGAVHYHLAADHQEKVFMVALRTMPKDSTGVAHILEHTALCGSEKYPVRDPFFMMTRRSLNTFMNAMTSSDWTAYPFASQNDKDFDNLLSVYLDAVFFANLDELDFAQEGHRVEFEKMEDPTTDLVYKGVVFNEMKGAMSSPVSQLWQKISKHLFPTNTYHYNSGGEPSEITNLSYEQLKSFYTSHYHPSNAIFMTFGDMDVAEMHEKFDQQALARFDKQEQQWAVPLEQRLAAPIRVEESYAVETDDTEALKDKTHHVIAWLLGESANLKEQLEAHLLSALLLDNSASPLRKALEKCEFASAPSPMCGLEDSNREMSFMCGIEGSNINDAEAFEKLIFEILNDVAVKGVAQEEIDSVLHQLEFHQREVGGDGHPYGMQLIFSGMSAATHYGDPVAMINIEPALAALKEDSKDPEFVQNLVKDLLLSNRHFIRLSLRPDSELGAEELRIEKSKLEKMKAELSDDDTKGIIKQSLALKARQEQEDDSDLLPSVGLEDIPTAIKYPEPDDEATRQAASLSTSASSNITSYSTGTNGIVYQQLITNLPPLNAQELQLLPILGYTWTEVGAKGDYLQQQQKQAAYCGGISSYASIKPKAMNDNNQQNEMLAYYTFSGKALASNQQPFSDLMRETMLQGDFSDVERVGELAEQISARRLQGITGNGHGLAMQIAAAQVTEHAAMMSDISGLPLTQRLKASFGQPSKDQAATLASELQALQQKIVSQPTEVLLIQDKEQLAAHATSVAPWQQNYAEAPFSIQAADANTLASSASHSYWMVDSQVNYCAMAFPTVNQLHADAPALSVAAGILRNGFLHTAIREQGGAYGAGASQDSTLGIFKFYSYRDPRIEGTFDDFKASINWILNDAKDESLVEQSILGIIGSMDRPSSPAGEAKLIHHALKSGRTPARRLAYRQGLLAVTLADVKRVMKTYLLDIDGKKAVLAPKGTGDIAAKLGLNAIEL
ncbi:MAG: Zn-dependent M16 (insulinase) family peptidase [Oleispira sp.]|jgi:Zn-dependent M16 (insulinase) family peptidase